MKKTLLISIGFICTHLAAQEIKLIKTFTIGNEHVKNISISGDCKMIAAASQTKVKVWEIGSGKETVSTSGKDLVHFGNSSSAAITNSSSDIKTINSESGFQELVLLGRQEIMTDAKFSSGLSFIYTIGESGAVVIWDGKTGEEITGIKIGDTPLTKLAISNSGRRLAVCDINKTIHLINILDGEVSSSFSGAEDNIKSLHFSPNDDCLYYLTDDNKLFKQSLQEGFGPEAVSIMNGRCIDISSDGKYFAVGGINNGISIFSSDLKQLLKTEGSKSSVTDVHFSPDGKKLISSYSNGSVYLYDVSSFKISPTSYFANNYAPKISVTGVQLVDAERDKASHGKSISITITNTGKININDLYIQFLPSNAKIKLTDKDTVQVGEMASASNKQISVPLAANANYTKDAFIFLLKDKNNGVYTDTIKYYANFESTKPSGITIENHLVVSEDGKIHKGKQFTFKVVFTNPTSSLKEDIQASLLLPNNIILYDDKKLSIPSLKPEESNALEFGLLVGDNYAYNSIPLKIHVTSNSGAEDFPLVLFIEQETQANSASKTETPAKKEETLMRGNGDPLKGVNVANANKELKPGKYYALIIGIDNYKGTWNTLKNAVNDAKAVETVLRTKYKFDSFKTLYNEQASRTNVITHLEWLSENIKENDNVLIYYSGHGEFKKQLNKGYWVPGDATTNSTAQFISNSDLQTYLGGIKSKHTLLISDACFSGDIFRGNTVSVPFENNEKYYVNAYEKDSRQAISSGGNEPVMDGGKDGHSVFAYYFLKALNSNNGKYYDASQLFEQIKIPVINNSEQTPNFNTIKNTGDEGGHFIFIKK